jgi:hypothetical protein
MATMKQQKFTMALSSLAVKFFDRFRALKFQLFYIATLTERSLTSSASQIGRLRATHGAAHTVAYDGLAPSYPPPQLF